MLYFWLLVVAVATVCVAVVFLKRGRLRTGVVKSYREIRSDLIGALADDCAPTPTPPVRPSGLDGRLGGEVFRELSSNWPGLDAQWKPYWDAYWKILQSVRDELRLIDSDEDWYELLAPARRVFLVAADFAMEVNNGGLDQYFFNSAGDAAGMLVDSLGKLGCADLVPLVERANGVFPGGPARHREKRLAQIDALPDTASRVWGEIDTLLFNHAAFNDIIGPIGGRFVLDHPNDFFRDG